MKINSVSNFNNYNLQNISIKRNSSIIFHAHEENVVSKNYNKIATTNFAKNIKLYFSNALTVLKGFISNKDSFTGLKDKKYFT